MIMRINNAFNYSAVLTQPQYTISVQPEKFRIHNSFTTLNSDRSYILWPTWGSSVIIESVDSILSKDGPDTPYM